MGTMIGGEKNSGLLTKEEDELSNICIHYHKLLLVEKSCTSWYGKCPIIDKVLVLYIPCG